MRGLRRQRTYLAVCVCAWLLFTHRVQAEESELLLAAIAEQSKGYTRISGQFTQRRKIVSIDLTLNSAGRFRYTNAEGIDWQLVSPIETHLHINADGIFGNSTAEQALANSSFPATLMLNIFAGDLAALRSFFVVEASGSLKAWEVELTPLNHALQQQLKSIVLRGSDTAEHIHIAEQSGDTLELELRAVEQLRAAEGE